MNNHRLYAELPGSILCPMKPIVIAALFTLLAGCAQFSDGIRHPVAASGGSTAAPANPYPYNAPYGI